MRADLQLRKMSILTFPSKDTKYSNRKNEEGVILL